METDSGSSDGEDDSDDNDCFLSKQPGSQTKVQRIKQMSSTIEKSHQVVWLGEGRLASAAVTGAIQVKISLSLRPIEHFLPW